MSLADRVAARFIAKTFPTMEALRQYLRDHPKANKSKHKVAPQEKTKKPDSNSEEWSDQEKKDYAADLRKKMKVWEDAPKKELTDKEKAYGKQVKKVQDYWDKHDSPPPDTDEYKIPSLKNAYSYGR